MGDLHVLGGWVGLVEWLVVVLGRLQVDTVPQIPALLLEGPVYIYINT